MFDLEPSHILSEIQNMLCSLNSLYLPVTDILIETHN